MSTTRSAAHPPARNPTIAPREGPETSPKPLPHEHHEVGMHCRNRDLVEDGHLDDEPNDEYEAQSLPVRRSWTYHRVAAPGASRRWSHCNTLTYASWFRLTKGSDRRTAQILPALIARRLRYRSVCPRGYCHRQGHSYRRCCRRAWVAIRHSVNSTTGDCHVLSTATSAPRGQHDVDT